MSESPTPIIVIGASLGGMEALKILFSQLSSDLRAAVLVVWHTPPESPDLLPSILQRATSLPVLSAQDAAPLLPGRAYIARPDHHLVVKLRSDEDTEGVICLTRGPKENRFRPSIDVLFRSAAVAFGPRVIGVILTGALDDGSAGLYAVKASGGKAIVQDPMDAECPNMPINAMRAVQVDTTEPVAVMGKALLHLVNEAMKGEATVPEQPESQTWKAEVRIALEDGGIENGLLDFSEPSLYTCPECHGVLMQIQEGNHIRFRCHTGHAYSLDALLADLTKSTEDALWNALRAIQESELLLTHLSEHLRNAGDTAAAEKCLAKMIATRHRGDIVRQATLDSEAMSIETIDSKKPEDND